MGTETVQQPVAQPPQDVVDDLAAIVSSGRVLNGPECARFVCALYEVECTGGSLHIVTDDGNLGDDSVDSCIAWARERGDRFGELLAIAMRRMRKTARGKAVDLGKDIELAKARAAMPAWLRDGRCEVTVERTAAGFVAVLREKQ